MYIIAATGQRTDSPEIGERYYVENPCTPDGGHEYADRICPQCGRDFCWSCCGATNVHEGGKHRPDYMECPECGHDWYQD